MFLKPLRIACRLHAPSFVFQTSHPHWVMHGGPSMSIERNAKRETIFACDERNLGGSGR